MVAAENTSESKEGGISNNMSAKLYSKYMLC